MKIRPLSALPRMALLSLSLATSISVAASPFAGTWTLQPEATTFEQRPLDLMIERGSFRRSDCAKVVEVAADGAQHPVKDQPLFDSMSVRIRDSRQIDVVQDLGGKQTWKAEYTVAQDRQSMTLAYEDDRTARAVTGVIQFSRLGGIVEQAHALSGTWTAQKLMKISPSAMTLTIEDRTPGIAMTWSDGRSVESKLDASYYPLGGYLEGATVSVLNSRPDLLAINRLQGVVPVEVSRAIVSADGATLSFKQTDWLCRGLTNFVYHRSGARE